MLESATTNLGRDLKEHAKLLGFELAGITLPGRPSGWERFQSWLDSGYDGEMAYLSQGAAARRSPESVLPGVKSIVMLGLSYHQPTTRQDVTPPLHGRVATYAHGQDYHEVLWAKLNKLSEWLQGRCPGAKSRGIVDTAPLLERDFARLAGLGWFGKNTMLIHKRLGSFYFIASLLTTAELVPDQPHVSSHCGTCTACLDACPTNAFPAPGVLDATRCISYLTIELRQPIPTELRKGLGDWVFGCDVCQDVCPWNRKAPPSDEPALSSRPQGERLNLIELLNLTPEAFRERFRHTALWRSKRQGLLRNACIVLGNQCDPRSVPALIGALNDQEPLVRGAAAWALGQFRAVDAREALLARLLLEPDATVRKEIAAAMDYGEMTVEATGVEPATPSLQS